MISPEEARRRILSALSPLPSELIATSDGLSRVLAAPVTAQRTQPPADLSAMDGYAMRAEDASVVPKTLSVLGECRAGAEVGDPLQPGEAVRIFTGAPLPEGADSVVIQEATETLPGAVRILQAPEPGRHIRHAGLDFRQGETLLEPGTRLAPRHLALAAAADCCEIVVHRRPRIGLLATGDELVRPGEPYGPGQIIDAITPSLTAFVAVRGGIACDLGIAADDSISLQTLAKAAVDMDMLVTIGGASAGDYDLVKSALGDSGLALDFWKVAMKPGKPLIFGRIGATPMLGLPGNPVSALVTALLFLGPAIDRLQGAAPRLPARMTATLTKDLESNGPRQEYMRANLDRVDCSPHVTPHSLQDSSMLAAFARSDVLLVRPPHDPPRTVGQTVEILLLEAATGA